MFAIRKMTGSENTFISLPRNIVQHELGFVEDEMPCWNSHMHQLLVYLLHSYNISSLVPYLILCHYFLFKKSVILS